MKFHKVILYNVILLIVSDALLYIGNMGINNELLVPVALTAKFLVLFSLFYFAKKSDWKIGLTKTTSTLSRRQRKYLNWPLIIRSGLTSPLSKVFLFQQLL